VAHADTASGAQAADEAEQLAKAGAFTEAAVRFREAYRLDPLPKYLCNVGVAYQKAKQLAKAHLYLTECLRTGVNLDTAFLAKVGGVVSTLENTLRTSGFVAVEVVVSPDTASLELETFDRDEKFIGSRTLWMTTGRHTASVAASGFTARSVDIEATATTGKVVIELVPVGGPVVPPMEPPPRVEPPPTTSSRVTLPYIVAGTAVLLAGGAIGFEIAGRSKLHDAEDATMEQVLETLYSQANRRHYVAQALAVGALAGAGVAVYLFLRPRSESSTVVAPTASSSAAGLVLSGRF
jgi:hypothetical protein